MFLGYFLIVASSCFYITDAVIDEFVAAPIQMVVW